MNEAEAQEMIKALALHYGEPVMPVSRYCRKIEQFVRLSKDNRTPEHQAVLLSELLQVTKSNFLARLLYGNEEPRTEKCPEHDGHWSGCYPTDCEHGCGYTGWLPNKKD